MKSFFFYRIVQDIRYSVVNNYCETQEHNTCISTCIQLYKCTQQMCSVRWHMMASGVIIVQYPPTVGGRGGRMDRERGVQEGRRGV